MPSENSAVTTATLPTLAAGGHKGTATVSPTSGGSNGKDEGSDAKSVSILTWQCGAVDVE